MANLSFTELENLWVQAGGPAALASVMAAIALAESGGNAGATNPTDNGGRQTSWGLWQISDGTHNAPAGWSDPLGNAKLAVQKYYSQGLGAWGTYTSGAYQKFLGAAGAATGATATTGGGWGSADTSSATPGKLLPPDWTPKAKAIAIAALLAAVGVMIAGAAGGGQQKEAA